MSFPDTTISAPFAPAFMIFSSVQCSILRKFIPFSSDAAMRLAIIAELSSGTETSSTFIWTLSMPNFFWMVSVSSLMVAPLRPITRPGLSTRIASLVISGVFCICTPT